MNVVKSIGGPDREQGKKLWSRLSFLVRKCCWKQKYKGRKRKVSFVGKVQFDHNHSLNRDGYFKFLSVSDETAQYYTELFSHCDCGPDHAQGHQTMPQTQQAILN